MAKVVVPSQNYGFQSISAELIIREAYERVGILGDLLVAQQLDSAVRSINFLLTDWSNSNVNLWTLKQDFISLIPGVKIYPLPIQTQKIIQCELRTTTRQNFNGLPFSSEGNAEDAFDADSKTACTQEDVNGYIGYSYHNAQIITFVGIQSNIDTVYNIVIEASNDNNNWDLLLELEDLPFITGINQWFNLNNILPYSYYRIKQQDAVQNVDKPLDIQEIYFNNLINDTTMTEVSRYEYLSYPRKNELGRPSVYYVNYQVNPELHIWQSPSPQYNCMFYSAQQMIPTVDNYTAAIWVPSSFYQSLVWGLALTLAAKYAPDKMQFCKAEYEQAMNAAIVKNSVEVPLTLGVYNS